jgi:branched-chain amino acid transport system substrate-binding protein
MKKLWIGVIALLVIALVVVLIFTHTTKESGEIKIGAILPLTGDAAKYGIEVKEGIDMARDEILNSGGVLGRKLEIAYEDSKMEPREGVNAIQKLIAIEKIQIVIGDVGSSVTIAMTPIANKYGIVLLSPASSSPKITNTGIFRVWPSDDAEGKVMADVAVKELGRGKFAVLYANNEYGVGLKNIFEQEVKLNGGTILISEGFDEGTKDFRTQLSKVQNFDVDALYIASYYTEGAQIVRQAKELGLTVQMLSCVGIYESKFLELAQGAAEGIVFTAPSYDPNSTQKGIADFVTTFKTKFGRVPGVFQAHGYDALMVIITAIRNANSVEPSKIKQELFKIKGYQGASGTFGFEPTGDVNKSAEALTVKDGKFQPFK